MTDSRIKYYSSWQYGPRGDRCISFMALPIFRLVHALQFDFSCKFHSFEGLVRSYHPIGFIEKSLLEKDIRLLAIEWQDCHLFRLSTWLMVIVY